MCRRCEYPSERIVDNIKRSCASISTSTISTYFAELKISLEGITTEFILNYDRD